jgi:hypothetical protein
MMMGDLDGNQTVNLADMAMLAQAIGSVVAATGGGAAPAEGIAMLGRADLNHDGTIDRGDVLLFVRSLGQSYTPPAAVQSVPAAPAALLATWRKTPEPSLAVRTGFFTLPDPSVTGREVFAISAMAPLETPGSTSEVIAYSSVPVLATAPLVKPVAPTPLGRIADPPTGFAVDAAMVEIGPEEPTKVAADEPMGEPGSGLSLDYRTRPAAHDKVLADEWNIDGI